MITYGIITRTEGDGITVQLSPSAMREIEQKKIVGVELRLDDGRSISAEQRKKIFAVIRDIALHTGHEPEEIRGYLTWDFCLRSGYDWFSLSSVDMTTAKEFINYLIEFCFKWDISTRDTLLNETDDIGKYLYLCLEHRKCAICNARAEVHHVDHVGLARNREKICHLGLRAIALCHTHHMEAHRRQNELFEENHVYGIKLDEYLCRKLHLKYKE